MLFDGEVIYGDHLLGLVKEQFLRKSVEEKEQVPHGEIWKMPTLLQECQSWYTMSHSVKIPQ